MAADEVKANSLDRRPRQSAAQICFSGRFSGRRSPGKLFKLKVLDWCCGERALGRNARHWPDSNAGYIIEFLAASQPDSTNC